MRLARFLGRPLLTPSLVERVGPVRVAARFASSEADAKRQEERREYIRMVKEGRAQMKPLGGHYMDEQIDHVNKLFPITFGIGILTGLLFFLVGAAPPPYTQPFLRATTPLAARPDSGRASQ